LVDRTKTQISWLEVQKEKYKRKGLSEQITAIKKTKSYFNKNGKEKRRNKKIDEKSTT